MSRFGTQQGMSATQNLDFVLEFADPPAGSHEFLGLGCRATGQLPAVDLVLLDPVVDRGLSHIEIDRDLSN